MELNKIICGDSTKVLDIFEDKTFDFILTSPPYDELRAYTGFEFNFRTIAQQLFRVLKDGGVMIWVVGDSVVDGSESGTSFEQVLYFKKCGFLIHDTMIYEKSGIPFPSLTRYNQSFEYMFVLAKGKPKTINLISDKKNKMFGESRKNTKQRTKNGFSKSDGWTIKEYGVRDNIWRYSTGSNKSSNDEIAFEHPAIFPESLAADHIKSWSNEGDLVLDPFLGSGTTAKMAKMLKRDYIGIDISKEYCELAEKRIKMLPKPMF